MAELPQPVRQARANGLSIVDIEQSRFDRRQAAMVCLRLAENRMHAGVMNSLDYRLNIA